MATLVKTPAEDSPAVPVGRTALSPEDDETAVLVNGYCGIHQLIGRNNARGDNLVSKAPPVGVKH